MRWHVLLLLVSVLASITAAVGELRIFASPAGSPAVRSFHDGDQDTERQVAVSGRIRVVEVPSDGIVPDAEIDGRGVVHLVYYLDGNVWYVRSEDDGRQWSEPLQVNSEDGFAYGGAYRGPDLAIGPSGTLHVAWYNAGYQQRRPQEDWGVMYARMLPGSDRFETSRNLNRRPSDNFSIAAGDDGQVAVVWMADGVYVTSSANDGESFAEPIDLRTDPCECCGSRAAFVGERLCVLYRDKVDDVRDTYLAQLLADPPSDVFHDLVSETPWPIQACPMTGCFLQPSGQALTAGWETDGDIFFARLLPGGDSLHLGEIRVARGGQYPVALTAFDGVSAVAWKSDGRLGWRFFDAQNEPIGPPRSVACTSVDRPAGVVTAEGLFLIFP